MHLSAFILQLMMREKPLVAFIGQYQRLCTVSVSRLTHPAALYTFMGFVLNCFEQIRWWIPVIDVREVWRRCPIAWRPRLSLRKYSRAFVCRIMTLHFRWHLSWNTRLCFGLSGHLKIHLAPGERSHEGISRPRAATSRCWGISFSCIVFSLYWYGWSAHHRECESRRPSWMRLAPRFESKAVGFL